MPNSMDPSYALSNLRHLQENHEDNTVVFHCAFIKGQNDSLESVQNLADFIKSYDFPKTKFNLVRYNPPPMSETQETDINKLNNIFEIMNGAVTNNINTQSSRVIKKVGPDVYASCGMFFKDVDSAIENLNEMINEA